MPLKDDEDFVPQSNQDVLKSREQVQKEQAERKAKQKGELGQLQRAMLQQQIDADGTYDALADEETKRLQQIGKDDEQPETFGRKEPDELVLDAQADVDIDTAIALEQIEQEEREESTQEYHDDAA